ncbi:predicted protein [Sclerotinia sclerotiorum 1980 UF-70]|uniref:Uncharacterized protein n=1 Tax=Sclerotinia sclerotiorum (strain ATCC 18683 / 1980 / Ss-1) TaxID=665079 RepID=A7E984_SCLS1|nr:predicted protein [Sclerotinia sclerotiorum 1980 UF-70]EDN96936.1 predicted protein [Sclerotinia sclerotiorum 1980 UF-70]
MTGRKRSAKLTLGSLQQKVLHSKHGTKYLRPHAFGYFHVPAQIQELCGHSHPRESR